MEWKRILDETVSQINEIRDGLYKDKNWKHDVIPSRKELKQLVGFVETMEKDFQWLVEYKNPTKKNNRKIRLVEIKPELSQFMRLKERGLSGYPENYILLFHLHHLHFLDALDKNQINTEFFNKELKHLYPEMTGKVSLFKLQSFIKNYIVLNESGKRKTIEIQDKKKIEDEIQFLKDMKNIKDNKEEFKKKWNEFILNLKNHA